MALRALQAGVFSIQFESRLRMVEGLRVPADNLEILAVMLRVAANAISSCRRRRKHRRVIPAPSRDPRCNVFVTLQAAILRLAGAHFVAGHASRRAIPLAVSF